MLKTVSVKGRYNPYSFSTTLNDAGRIQNRTGSVSAGFKYWPFFVYSGFYYGGRIQWSRYNSGGIISHSSEEGDAVGIGMNLGYSLLVTKHLNLEFGLGLWFGGTKYKKYNSTTCGKLTEWGLKPFIAPNDIQITLLYTFGHEIHTFDSGNNSRNGQYIPADFMRRLCPKKHQDT